MTQPKNIIDITPRLRERIERKVRAMEEESRATREATLLELFDGLADSQQDELIQWVEKTKRFNDELIEIYERRARGTLDGD